MQLTDEDILKKYRKQAMDYKEMYEKEHQKVEELKVQLANAKEELRLTNEYMGRAINLLSMKQ